jgi:precorrin-2 dehydrogenase / sirohydrochlorin ferrochelatase
MHYAYPVMLDVDGKRCLVVGEGPLAEEKARGLSAAGAALERAPDYRPGMLAGCFLAVSCLNDKQINAALFQEAERGGVLFNALDDPDRCRFVFPSIHRQGDLVLAISTTGQCPALAVRLREALAPELGPEYAEFLAIAGQLRKEIAARWPEFEQRRKIWYSLVDSGAIAMLKQGRRDEARQLLHHLAAHQH